MVGIKKRCPSCVTLHRSHYLFVEEGATRGKCSICGVSFEVITQNDRARHIGGIDLVLLEANS